MAVRQTVVSDTNSPKTLTFNKLRGVDYSSSPFEVNASRATSMKNMINEDGVNHKRHGFTDELKVNENYNIIDICKLGDHYLFAHKYYSTSYGGNYLTIYGWDGNDDIAQFVNFSYDNESNDVFVFLNNNNIFIPYKKIIISYDPVSKSYSTHTDGDELYTPTTTISINSNSESGNSGVSYEEPNILTAKRKNSLIGDKINTVKVTFVPFNSSKDILSAKMYATFGGANISGYSNSVSYQNLNLMPMKDLSFRVVPGKYSVYASVTTSNVTIADTDELCDEGGNSLGEPTGDGRKYIVIEEDISIYVKESGK